MTRHIIRRVLLAIVTTVAAVIIGYLIFLAFSLNGNNITTLNVVSSEVENGVFVDGIIVRDESLVLKQRGVRTLVTAENCSKVATGETLALSFGVDKDYENYVVYKQKQEKLAELTDISNNASISQSTATINSAIRKIGNVSDYNNCRQVMPEIKQSLEVGVLQRTFALQDDSAVEDAISVLRNELEIAKKKLNIDVQITAGKSGYFVKNVDGWEQLLNSERIQDMTYADYQSLLSQGKNEPDYERVIGKIISGWNWYYLFTIDAGVGSGFYVGDDVTISLQDQEYVFEIITKQMSDDQASCLVVCRCDRMLLNFAETRKIGGLVVTSKQNGFRLPAESIHVVNGQTGVYVVEGAEVKFKPVTVLASEGQYYLLEVSTTDRNQLFTNDVVIVSGKNIYDGKILK